MKINYLSITLWFNIFENHEEFLKILPEYLGEYFEEYQVLEKDTDNYTVPIIMAHNDEKKLHLSFSKINLQYNAYDIDLDKIGKFKNAALKLYELLTDNQIPVLHTALFTNVDVFKKEPLEIIKERIIPSYLNNEDIVDGRLTFGQKYDDMFYKVITVSNNRQFTLPPLVDANKRPIPLPLRRWNVAKLKKDTIEVSYEINDKYSYDTLKNYQTMEFHLNKMLYILEHELKDDIDSIIPS